MNHQIPTPEFQSLTELLLLMSGERSVDRVMHVLVERLVQTRPHQARVCIWLVENNELHLRASARQAGHEDNLEWQHANGDYRRTSLEDSLIGPTAVQADSSIRVARYESNWPAYPDWAKREGIIGYGAAPIRHRGELLGVLGVFLKYRFTDDDMWKQGIAWTKVLADYLGAMIANARAFEQIEQLRDKLEMENAYHREESAKFNSPAGIIGSSPPLARAIEQASLVASTDASVLILGESGTGKEVFTQLIHDRSPRASRPLIRVNCAAVPRELFESEFFGHVKGSFTGAVKDRVGRFKLADGGTLFLDEVGEIPLDLQGKLLRVLQEGTFEAIGEERSQRVNVRIIAATNRDLQSEIAAKRFREDLYYRLSVFPITLPPLRERLSDVSALAMHFIEQTARRFGRPVPVFKKNHATELQNYDWPGNIRELQHVVERAMINCVDSRLHFDIGPKVRKESPSDQNIHNHAAADSSILTYADLEHLERRNLEAAIAAANGKISGSDGAATLLGINASTLFSKIKKLGVNVDRSKSNQTKASQH